MKVILIDIDNTLLSFDEYVKQSMQQGFAYYHLKPYEPYMYDVFHQENDKLWQQIEQGTLTLQQLQKIRWNNIFQQLNIDFDGSIFEDYFRNGLYNSAIVENHAKEMLDYLKDKYTLCVASNGPYKQQCNRLKLGGLYDYFSHYFISEKVGASKPSTQFFTYVMEELNQTMTIQSSDMMIIGDSLSSDMALGTNHGMHTCFYQRKQGQVANVDYIIHDLVDVKQFL